LEIALIIYFCIGEILIEGKESRGEQSITSSQPLSPNEVFRNVDERGS
jgi:hypothetical protein